MTGPEHYTDAERLVTHSQRHTDQGNTADDKIAELAAAQAQVHATLAAIPPDHLRVYEWTQQRLLERLTEPRCLDAFRDAWEAANERGEKGQRVEAGMTAAIQAALL